MRWIVFGLALLCLDVSRPPAFAAGPSTPEDWQKMYDACFQGMQTVARQKGLGHDFPARFCGCARDELKRTADKDRNAAYQGIQSYCLQRATQIHGYPEAGIANLRATCAQRQDIPATAMQAYCDCYVDLVQKNVPWRDFLLLDSAISTKGLAKLDAEEKAILGKALEATFYCSTKATR